MNSEKEKTKLSQYAKDPLIVGEMLRQFLVALPEPLLTFQLYDSFLLTLSTHPIYTMGGCFLP